MTTKQDKPLPRVSQLPVYFFSDLLKLLDKKLAEHASDRLAESDISFGDAEYTLVRGQRIAALLEDAYADLHENEDQEASAYRAAKHDALYFINALKDSWRGEPVLVAIDG